MGHKTLVNGTAYENVGVRAKGNTSLSMVVSSDSDRYSFKISFDEDTLEAGSIKCPGCGETLEFDLGEEDED